MELQKLTKDPRVLALAFGLTLTALLGSSIEWEESNRLAARPGLLASTSYFATRRIEIPAAGAAERPSVLSSVIPFSTGAAHKTDRFVPPPAAPAPLPAPRREFLTGPSALDARRLEAVRTAVRANGGLETRREGLRDSLRSAPAGGSTGAFLSLTPSSPAGTPSRPAVEPAPRNPEGLLKRLGRAIVSRLGGGTALDSRAAGRSSWLSGAWLAESKAGFPEASSISSSSAALKTAAVLPMPAVPDAGSPVTAGGRDMQGASGRLPLVLPGDLALPGPEPRDPSLAGGDRFDFFPIDPHAPAAPAVSSACPTGGHPAAPYDDAGPKANPVRPHRVVLPPPATDGGSTGTPPPPPPAATGDEDVLRDIRARVVWLLSDQASNEAYFQTGIWPLFDATQEMVRKYGADMGAAASRFTRVAGHLRTADRDLPWNAEHDGAHAFASYAAGQLEGVAPWLVNLQAQALAGDVALGEAFVNQGTLATQTAGIVSALDRAENAVDPRGWLRPALDDVTAGVNDHLRHTIGGTLADAENANDYVDYGVGFQHFRLPVDVGVQTQQALDELRSRLDRDPYFDVAWETRLKLLEPDWFGASNEPVGPVARAFDALERTITDQLLLAATARTGAKGRRVYAKLQSALTCLRAAKAHLRALDGNDPSRLKGVELIETARSVTEMAGNLRAVVDEINGN